MQDAGWLALTLRLTLETEPLTEPWDKLAASKS